MLWSFNSDICFILSVYQGPTYLKVWSRTNIDLEAESGTALHRNYKKIISCFINTITIVFWYDLLTHNPPTLTDLYYAIQQYKKRVEQKIILFISYYL